MTILYEKTVKKASSFAPHNSELMTVTRMTVIPEYMQQHVNTVLLTTA